MASISFISNLGVAERFSNTPLKTAQIDQPNEIICTCPVERAHFPGAAKALKPRPSQIPQTVSNTHFGQKDITTMDFYDFGGNWTMAIISHYKYIQLTPVYTALLKHKQMFKTSNCFDSALDYLIYPGSTGFNPFRPRHNYQQFPLERATCQMGPTDKILPVDFANGEDSIDHPRYINRMMNLYREDPDIQRMFRCEGFASNQMMSPDLEQSTPTITPSSTTSEIHDRIMLYADALESPFTPERAEDYAEPIICCAGAHDIFQFSDSGSEMSEVSDGEYPVFPERLPTRPPVYKQKIRQHTTNYFKKKIHFHSSPARSWNKPTSFSFDLEGSEFTGKTVSACLKVERKIEQEIRRAIDHINAGGSCDEQSCKNLAMLYNKVGWLREAMEDLDRSAHIIDTKFKRKAYYWNRGFLSEYQLYLYETHATESDYDLFRGMEDIFNKVSNIPVEHFPNHKPDFTVKLAEAFWAARRRRDGVHRHVDINMELYEDMLADARPHNVPPPSPTYDDSPQFFIDMQAMQRDFPDLDFGMNQFNFEEWLETAEHAKEFSESSIDKLFKFLAKLKPNTCALYIHVFCRGSNIQRLNLIFSILELTEVAYDRPKIASMAIYIIHFFQFLFDSAATFLGKNPITGAMEKRDVPSGSTSSFESIGLESATSQFNIQESIKELTGLDIVLDTNQQKLIAAAIGMALFLTGGTIEFMNIKKEKRNVQSLLRILGDSGKSAAGIGAGILTICALTKFLVECGGFGPVDKTLEDFGMKLASSRDEMQATLTLLSANPGKLPSIRADAMLLLQTSRDLETTYINFPPKFNLNRYSKIYSDNIMTRTALKDLISSIDRLSGDKQEPVCINFYGPGGVGKSSAVSKVIEFLSEFENRKLTRFCRNAADQFWSGYLQQDVVVYDDFGTVAEPEAEAAEFMKVVSCGQMPLNMADLAFKGLLFNSKYVILCTNHNTTKAKAVDIDAFERRKLVNYKVTRPNLETFLADSNKDHSKGKPLITTNDYKYPTGDLYYDEMLFERFRYLGKGSVESATNGEVGIGKIRRIAKEAFEHQQAAHTKYLTTMTSANPPKPPRTPPADGTQPSTSGTQPSTSFSIPSFSSGVKWTKGVVDSAVEFAKSQNGPTESTCSYVVALHGPPGTGKTTILHRLQHLNPEIQVVDEIFDKPAEEAARIIDEAYRNGTKLVVAYNDDKFKKFKHKIIRDVGRDTYLRTKRRLWPIFVNWKKKPGSLIRYNFKNGDPALNVEMHHDKKPVTIEDIVTLVEQAHVSTSTRFFQRTIFVDENDLPKDLECIDVTGITSFVQIPALMIKHKHLIVHLQNFKRELSVLMTDQSTRIGSADLQTVIRRVNNKNIKIQREFPSFIIEESGERFYVTAVNGYLTILMIHRNDPFVPEVKVMEERVVAGELPNDIPKYVPKDRKPWFNFALQHLDKIFHSIYALIAGSVALMSLFDTFAAKPGYYWPGYDKYSDKIPTEGWVEDSEELWSKIHSDPVNYGNRDDTVQLSSGSKLRARRKRRIYNEVDHILPPDAPAEDYCAREVYHFYSDVDWCPKYVSASHAPGGRSMKHHICSGCTRVALHLSKKKNLRRCIECCGFESFPGYYHEPCEHCEGDEYWASAKTPADELGYFLGRKKKFLDNGIQVETGKESIKPKKNLVETGKAMIQPKKNKVETGKALIKPKQVKVEEDSFTYPQKKADLSDVEKAANEGSLDPAFRDVSRIVQENLIKVRGGFALMLKGHYGVVPNHFLVLGPVTLEDGEQCETVKQWPNKDLCMIKLPKHKPMYRDISRHISKGGLIEDVYPSYMILKEEAATFMYPVKCHTVTKQIRTDNGVAELLPVELATGACYNSYITKPGDCGSPIIKMVRNGAPRVVGIHTAANDIRGFCSLLTEAVLEPIPVCTEVGSDFKQENYTVEIEPVVLPNGATANHALGTVDDNDEFVPLTKFHPAKTRVAVSPLRNHRGEVKYTVNYNPPILSKNDPRNPEGVDPLLKNVDKFARKHAPLDQQEINTCMEELAYAYVADFQRHDLKFRPLTNTESINGVANCRESKPIDLNTSPGYPWARLPRDKPGKRDYFTVVEDDNGQNRRLFFSPKGQMIKERVAQLEAAFDRGETPVVCFDGNLKDEPLKDNKIADIKTRSIVAAPIDFVLLQRKYLHPILYGVMRSRDRMPIRVGLVANGKDFDTMWKDIRRAGGKAFDGDYKEFDGSCAREEILGCATFYKTCYKLLGHNNAHTFRMIDGIFRVLSEPHVTRGHFLFKADGTVVSGEGTTVFTDSLINFQRLSRGCRRALPPAQQNAADVIKEFPMAIGGDDHIVVVPKKHQHQMNFHIMKQCIEEHGGAYTPANKEEDQVLTNPDGLKEIDECQFFKRLPYYDPAIGSYVGRLMEEGFSKMCSTTNADKPYFYKHDRLDFNMEAMTSTFDSYLSEASLHDKEFYDSAVDHVVEVSETFGIPIRELLPHRVMFWKTYYEGRNGDIPALF